MKLAVAVVLVTLAAWVSGRTVSIEKLVVEISDDTDADAGETLELLQDILETDDEPAQIGDCKNGTCNFCAGKGKFKVCFVATLQQTAIVLELTFNGHELFKKTISVTNPPPICLSALPFLPGVSDVCVELKNVDLQKGAGCVYISFKVMHLKKLSFKVGCFKLKKDQDDVTAFISDAIRNVETSVANDDSDTEQVTILATPEPVVKDVGDNNGAEYVLFFKSLKKN